MSGQPLSEETIRERAIEECRNELGALIKHHPDQFRNEELKEALRKVERDKMVVPPLPVQMPESSYQRNTFEEKIYVPPKPWREVELEILDEDAPIPTMFLPWEARDLMIKVVSKAYDTTPEEMFTKTRVRNVVYARQHAMYLFRKKTRKSLPHIGKIFGGLDHTTVLHGIRAYEQRLRQHRADTQKEAAA